MARLWSCGFELQSVTSGVEVDTVTGSPTIDTTTKRSGAAALRCNTTSAAAYINHQIMATTHTANVYIRFYLYIATSLSATGDIFRAYSINSGASSYILRLSATNTIVLLDGNAQVDDTSTALSTGAWYRVESSYISSTAATEVKIYDSSNTLIDTLTGDSGYTNDDPSLIRLGMVDSGTGDLYFDDVAWNDDSGTAQTSYPGDGSIIHMHPDSAGDAAATAGLFSDIDEITPDDATGYIEIDTDSGGQQANYNFQSWAEAGGLSRDAITLVQIGVRHRPETAASMSYTPQIKSQSAGTTVDGTATTHNDTTWKTNGDVAPLIYKLTSYVDPQGSGNWTPALLDTMIAGVNVTDGNPDVWISTIWALVEYVPGGSASMSPSVSPSLSPSASLSPSSSESPSMSPSLSPSSSVSPSRSPSASPSVSPSASPSLSSSMSPSLSPSVSPSLSPSLSPSMSPSLSPSSSMSPSPSPGYKEYSRGNYVALPTGIDNLETAYDATDLSNVATKDDVRVSQGATDQFAIHQFKDYVGAPNSCTVEWEGQTNHWPMLSTVYLQIYNLNTTTWDTIDSDNTTGINTDFTLTANVADLTNYKDANGVIVCRVYQED